MILAINKLSCLTFLIFENLYICSILVDIATPPVYYIYNLLYNINRHGKKANLLMELIAHIVTHTSAKIR